MDGSNGEATKRYISTGTDAAGVPMFQKSNRAKPPKTAKIGRPTTVTRASTTSESESTPAVPTGMANPYSAGMPSPSDAMARPFQLELACHTARNAITANPASMIDSATHFGTPGNRSLPAWYSDRTNTKLAHARHDETAASVMPETSLAGA